MSSLTRILIIRFSSIGDVVLTTPIVRALKEQIDGKVEIHYITKKAFGVITESNPNIDRVITIKKHVSEAEDVLKSVRYDYVIDLHNNIRSRQVKRLTKAAAFTVDKRNVAKWLYVNTKKEVLPIGHFTTRCFDAIAPLNVYNDQGGLEYNIPSSDEITLDVLPSNFHSGYIAYAIGGQTGGKILPTSKAIDLCQRINSPIILLGGPDDVQRGDQIAAALGDRIWNASGKFSLNQSASLLKQARCVLTHDTGLMHIASALNKKVVSLWFSTTPALGFAPWKPGEGSVMVEADCPKRPTSKLGNRGFSGGCVFNIDLEQVVMAVNS